MRSSSWHDQHSRRSFLRRSAAVGAVLAVPGVHTFAQDSASGPNDQIGLGVIGAGGRGGQLANEFSRQSGVRFVGVAEPDTGRAAGLAKKLDCEAYGDMRRMLDDPNLNAVIIATCNHWHCLAAIWAMQAGKDVYVEKPLSHSQWEGRKVIEAARKYDRVVQVGTQQRSDPMQEEIKAFLHEEKALGEIQYAQANRLGVRGPVGRRDQPLPIPEQVDYDVWLGPAEDEPLYRNQLHYDWHWDWNTGSGEMGNWGVHVLDDVRNVVYRDSVSTPSRIMAVGGRVAWDDAADTPNVHYALFETSGVPTLIALSNLSAGPDARGSWSTRAGRAVSGPNTGYVVACEGGYYLGQRGSGKAVDRDGKTIKSFKGGNMGARHAKNFLDAVRSRDASSLAAEVEVGHHSTGWCNLANVGFRAGERFSRDEALSINPKLDVWDQLLDELSAQLEPFGVKTADLQMSPVLSHDPETEQFVGEHADKANRFLKRSYREPYVIPEQV